MPVSGDFASPLTDSNRRPPPYHGGALPTELRGRGVTVAARTAVGRRRGRLPKGAGGRRLRPPGRWLGLPVRGDGIGLGGRLDLRLRPARARLDQEGGDDSWSARTRAARVHRGQSPRTLQERLAPAGYNAAPQGGVPERPKGTGCKPVGSAFGGSNPPAPISSRRSAGASLSSRYVSETLSSSSGGYCVFPFRSASSESAVRPLGPFRVEARRAKS